MPEVIYDSFLIAYNYRTVRISACFFAKIVYVYLSTKGLRWVDIMQTWDNVQADITNIIIG